MTGIINEVSLFSKALSEGNIKKLIDGIPSGFTVQPVAKLTAT